MYKIEQYITNSNWKTILYETEDYAEAEKTYWYYINKGFLVRILDSERKGIQITLKVQK